MQIFSLLAASLVALGIPDCSASPLTVHLVPHSHDDAGWIKTIDEYYFDDVKQIYDNIFPHLDVDPSKRFIVVEQIFFSRWFSSTTDSNRALFRRVLARRQVEFVMGGWVMNDEASSLDSDILNQLNQGMHYIYDTFGVIPRIGHQIDPFGHSAATPFLYAKMGFEAVILNRIPYDKKQELKSSRQLEFIWDTAKDQDAELLAHVLDQHYSSPPGFDFESDAPIDCNRGGEKKCKWLATHWLERSRGYPSNENFLQLAGDDFKWKDAKAQFTSWDNVITYINSHSEELGVRVRYSTLSEYFEALKRETDLAFTLYHGDFFPYADNADSYWTGYFSSKSNFKLAVRESANNHRLSELTTVGAWTSGALPTEAMKSLLLHLKRIRGVNAEVQHHDAITGTSKEYVTQAYLDDLRNAQALNQMIVSKTIAAIIDVESVWTFADYESISEALRETGQATIAVFKNGVKSRNSISLPVLFNDLEVFALMGQLSSQVSRSHSMKHGVFTLLVRTDGFDFFTIKRASQNISAVHTQTSNFVLENAYLRVTLLNKDAGFTISVLDKISETESDLSPHLMAYRSYSDSGQKSGAYIFRSSSDASHLDYSWSPDIELVRGDVADEIVIKYANSNVQIYRLYHDDAALELTTILTCIAPDNEVILRMRKPAPSCKLSTDSNGVMYIDRNVIKAGEYAANYYPISVSARLECPNDETLTIYTDRAMGIASQSPEEMELMIHRRTSMDDGRGVGEALDDSSIVETVINFVWSKNPNAALSEAMKYRNKPIKMVSSNIVERMPDMKSLLSPEDGFVTYTRILEMDESQLSVLIISPLDIATLRNHISTNSKRQANIMGEVTFNGLEPADTPRYRWRKKQQKQELLMQTDANADDEHEYPVKTIVPLRAFILTFGI